MHYFWPKSFLSLVLLGFAVVALPLLVALVNAQISMGRLAGQSTQAVYRSVGVTQGSRILLERIIALERKARQYEVLGDPHLLTEVKERHVDIVTTLQQLFPLSRDVDLTARLERLQKGEQDVFDTLISQPRGSEEQKLALQRFNDLNTLANDVYAQSNDLIVHEVDIMQQTVDRAKMVLVYQAIALIPFTLLFMALFTLLLSKPIRQLHKVIFRLGEGDFNTPAKVAGPRDLVMLGERLDWLRNQLADLERAKSKFVAQVSHELKTPLASIREGADLLADEVGGPLNQQQQAITAIIKKNSKQLQNLIENLLGFSKAQAKLTALHCTQVAMKTLIEEVLEDQKPVFLKKDLDMRLELDDVVLWGDRERLRTVIDNLLSNAVKYTPVAGWVRLCLFLDGEYAQLDVIDSGPGIPSHQKEKVFAPFYQGRPSPGPIKGTGLGLSIAREFVLAHGGELNLVDIAAGGTHFQMRLPLDKKEEAQ